MIHRFQPMKSTRFINYLLTGMFTHYSRTYQNCVTQREREEEGKGLHKVLNIRKPDNRRFQVLQ